MYARRKKNVENSLALIVIITKINFNSFTQIFK